MPPKVPTLPIIKFPNGHLSSDAVALLRRLQELGARPMVQFNFQLSQVITKQDGSDDTVSSISSAFKELTSKTLLIESKGAFSNMPFALSCALHHTHQSHVTLSSASPEYWIEAEPSTLAEVAN